MTHWKLDDIKSEVRNHIRRLHSVPEDDPDFTDEVHLYDYGYIDSFGAAALIAFLESHFSIKIDQTDLMTRSLNTIHAVAAFVEERQKGEL